MLPGEQSRPKAPPTPCFRRKAVLHSIAWKTSLTRLPFGVFLGSRKGQDPGDLKAQQQESNHDYSNPHRMNFEALGDRGQQ